MNLKMNKELVNARKQNIKLYSIYRAISLDLIFYYAIEYLFLTQVKSLSASDVVLGNAFFATFLVLMQIPASIIIDKIGTKKCTIIGNIFNVIFILFIIGTNCLRDLILAQFISALCFSFKNISDTALLQYSIPQCRKKSEIFSKIEGKGIKYYNYLNAITSIIAGLLYIVNPYAPMVCSLCFAIFATIISFGFEELKKYRIRKKVKKIERFKKYVNEFMNNIIFIHNSQRLRSLFIYSGVVCGILSIVGIYKNGLLIEMGAPVYVITAVIALLSLALAQGSKRQEFFNKKFKNKTLTVILVLMTIGIFGAGLVAKIKMNYYILILITTIFLCVIYYTEGLSKVLVSRYLSSFTNHSVLTQIIAINEMSRNFFKAIVSFIGAYIINITTPSNAIIIIGLFSLTLTFSLVSYMKTRLGLKPNEYGENEIIKEEKQ